MNRRSFFSTLIACLVGPFLAPKLIPKRAGFKGYTEIIYGDLFENIRSLVRNKRNK